MAVRKICKPKGCRASPRCEHPWWFDTMHQGKRWRMPVDDFALVRGATEPIKSKQTAERVWEPKFLGEIMAGRDPHVPPSRPKQETETVLTVAPFLDQYFTNYVEAEGLKSANTVSGHIKALKASLGELPVVALEKAPEISRFKAAYRKGHEVATVNRALGVLRAAINWGRFQDPAAALDESVSSFRREHQSPRRNEEGSADSPRRGADTARRVSDDEHGRAQVDRTRDA